MPELPEVETVKSGVAPFLENHSFISVSVYSPALRIPLPRQKLCALAGQKILSVTRRAKYILVNFSNRKTMIVHLGMTGAMTIFPPHDKIILPRDRHDHVVFNMDDGVRIVYRDPRRFGVIDVVNSDDVFQSKYFSHLGVEPLEKDFTPEYLRDAMKVRRAPIKTVIMDQSVVVGVGNIYASEALYLSRIHPETPAQDLSFLQIKKLVSAIKTILTAAIKSGGSTLRDYRHTNGDMGYFQFHFAVYDKAGKACPDCRCSLKKTGGIQRIVQAGRSSFFCPTVQKPISKKG